MSTIIETGIDYKKLDDTKYMRSYIMRLNDDLRYMLTNLDPEENFDKESLDMWIDYGETMNGVSRTVEEINIRMVDESTNITAQINQKSDEIDLCVKSGEVTSTINERLRIGTECIEIQTSRLTVRSGNFHLENNDLYIKGEIVSDAGSFGGFEIRKDSSGKPYLDAGASGTISGGSMDGTSGVFRSFSCAGTETDRSTMVLDEADVYMENCRITSTGMVFYGDMICMGNLDVARYVPSTDTYTDRKMIMVGGKIQADQNIWVELYSGTTNSGRVECYTIYSYIAGGEYSDSRLKYDISEIDGQEAIEMIREMRPVHYQMIDDDTKAMGFIAQDILRIEEKHGGYGMTDRDEEEGMYSLSYARFIPVMAAALKETDRILHGND